MAVVSSAWTYVYVIALLRLAQQLPQEDKNVQLCLLISESCLLAQVQQHDLEKNRLSLIDKHFFFGGVVMESELLQTSPNV
jgi:hypothetical protein